ncbi:MAG: hypothetical protein AB7P08_18630 [Burkholderiales bacterium]
MNAKSKHAELESIPGGYLPLSILWTAGETAARFHSEASARWYLRDHYAELAKARALALDCRRLYIHPERFDAVREEIAIAKAQARSGMMAAAA